MPDQPPSYADASGVIRAVSSGAPMPTTGAAFKCSVTFTRPADTTGYGVGDVIEGAKTLANIGPALGGDIMLTTALFTIERNAVIASEGEYILHFFSITPPSAIADNAVFDIPSGDRASYLGYISLGSPTDWGSTVMSYTKQINAHLKVASGGSLFCYLTTLGAYTPQSATLHKLQLHAIALGVG